VALVYTVSHALSLFYQVMTLNVAVNSYSNAVWATFKSLPGEETLEDILTYSSQEPVADLQHIVDTSILVIPGGTGLYSIPCLVSVLPSHDSECGSELI
jgi:hypothetical protein